jgi:hypothetical protein
MPKRITRVRSVKLPPNTICCYGSSKWGNPFSGIDSVDAFRAGVNNTLWYADCDANVCCYQCELKCNCECGNRLFFVGQRRLSVSANFKYEECFRDDISTRYAQITPEKYFNDLLKNIDKLNSIEYLADWIPLDKPSHIDILIELLNRRF